VCWASFFKLICIVGPQSNKSCRVKRRIIPLFHVDFLSLPFSNRPSIASLSFSTKLHFPNKNFHFVFNPNWFFLASVKIISFWSSWTRNYFNLHHSSLFFRVYSPFSNQKNVNCIKNGSQFSKMIFERVKTAIHKWRCSYTHMCVSFHALPVS